MDVTGGLDETGPLLPPLQLLTLQLCLCWGQTSVCYSPLSTGLATCLVPSGSPFLLLKCCRWSSGIWFGSCGGVRRLCPVDEPSANSLASQACCVVPEGVSACCAQPQAAFGEYYSWTLSQAAETVHLALFGEMSCFPCSVEAASQSRWLIMSDLHSLWTTHSLSFSAASRVAPRHSSEQKQNEKSENVRKCNYNCPHILMYQHQDAYV